MKAVIFDWGGVLIDRPAECLRAYCAEQLGVNYEVFSQVYDKHEPAVQRGTLAEGDLWNQVCSELGVPVPKTPSLWGDAFRHCYQPKEEVFQLARDLRGKGYKVGFLSNTEQPSMDFFEEQHYDMFDAKVFSCAEGVAKAEPEIYLLAAERLGVPPDEAVFIDDKEEWVAGAKEVGMAVILFHNPAQLRQELGALLGIEL